MMTPWQPDGCDPSVALPALSHVDFYRTGGGTQAAAACVMPARRGVEQPLGDPQCLAQTQRLPGLGRPRRRLRPLRLQPLSR
jgi:hypothetical protein